MSFPTKLIGRYAELLKKRVSAAQEEKVRPPRIFSVSLTEALELTKLALEDAQKEYEEETKRLISGIEALKEMHEPELVHPEPTEPKRDIWGDVP